MRYSRLNEIGRGASSIVYRAEDTITGDIVAIKVLLPDAGYAKREVSLGRQVTHRNVDRTYDLFIDEDDNSCIAMEFAGGGNLRGFMERAGELPLDRCLSIAQQILDGLEAAHREKIVHLDLKPENILLTADGTVKLSDFGQARFIGAQRHSGTSPLMGTLAYMSPEQQRELDCDARSDIYSFGIILHELISKTGGMPAYIDAAIQRCREIDVQRRFASVAEVRAAIRPRRHKRVVPHMTAPLLLTLAAVLVASLLVWNHVWTRQPGMVLAPAIPPPAVSAKAVPAPAPPKTIQRVAVMDFENLTGEKPLDPYAIGISETISTELGHLNGLTLVERNRVREAARALEHGTSEVVGKFIGADALVRGTFQKLGDKVRLTASVFDAGTGIVVREPSLVEGSFKDLFKLQGELAKQLAVAIEGPLTETDRRKFEGTSDTTPSRETFEAFSDGLYFLRNDLARDALAKFDRTLELDAHYPGIHYYRGMALEKLNRLDEAIEAFKSALPRSRPEQLVSWNWEAGFQAPEHGIIRGIDAARSHNQRDVFEAGRRPPGILQKRIVYGERNGKATVLHFIDAERHSERRVEIADEHIVLNTLTSASDSFIVLQSRDVQEKLPTRIGLYAFSADGSALWHQELTGYGNDLPKMGLAGDAFYLYFPALRRMDLLDARSGKLLWRREGVAADPFELPEVRQTKRYGEILIVKSQDTYRAIRRSNGMDAWTVPVPSEKASEFATDAMLVVFEPERRVFAVDLETGQTFAEVQIEQLADVVRTPFGPQWLTGAFADGDTVYVVSKTKEICSLDFRRLPATRTRLRWCAPVHKDIQPMRVVGNRLYVGTVTGEVVIVNTLNGAITTTAKLSDLPMSIEYAGSDRILVRSPGTLYSLDPQGMKQWEYSPLHPVFDNSTYVNGVMVVYTSDRQLSALDAETGKTLWQVSSARTPPYAFSRSGRLFILEENGVKEYAIAKTSDTISDKEALSELAQTYLAKGDLREARVFLERASAIDPDYPPLRLAGARLLKAQGHKEAAGRELARYAVLVGVDSSAGQRAISELKQQYGLLWQTPIGPAVLPDPVLIENRLVSTGRRLADEPHVVALDPRNGGVVWRYATERFAASALEDGLPFLWCVGGSLTDLKAATLYRVDIRTGERKQMALWRRPERVDQAWIASAAGRVFVATVAPDMNTATMEVGLAAFDAASGTKLWEKSEHRQANALELKNLIELFTAGKDGLSYSIGPQRWTVRATDGSPLPAVAATGASAKGVATPPVFLWPPSGFRLQNGRFYAFTDDGHAYAMLAGPPS